MAFAQGLIELTEKQNEELEKAFESETDFFECFKILNSVVENRQCLLFGMSHNFGRETPINTPTLNDLIDVWYEMKLWKKEIEDERRQGL